MAGPSPVSEYADIKSENTDGQAAAFGRRLRGRAHALGLSAAEIGRRAAIKKQTMTGYWNGERLCAADRLFALADALDVDARWLMLGTEPGAAGDMTRAEAALLAAFRRLAPDGRAALARVADAMHAPSVTLHDPPARFRGAGED